MKKKRLLAAALSAMLLLCPACGQGEEKGMKWEKSYSLLTDRTWNEGVSFTGNASNVPGQLEVGKEGFGKPNPKPEWRVGQWACKHNLTDVSARREISESLAVFEDASKNLTLDRSDGSFEMMLSGGVEYTVDGALRPRVDGEAWPHLLMEQPYLYQNKRTAETRLGDLDQLVYTIEFEISSFKDYSEEYAYDASLHTAQFVMFSTIFDNVEGSPGKGSGMWFGFDFFDARYDFPPQIAHQDTGKEDKTDLYIFSPEMRKVYNDSGYFDREVKIGKTYSLEIDALAYIKQAVDAAQADGFAQNIVVDNLSFSTMNIGFELTGIYDIGVKISALDIVAVRKDSAL